MLPCVVGCSVMLRFYMCGFLYTNFMYIFRHPFHIVCMQETLSPYVCHDQFRAWPVLVSCDSCPLKVMWWLRANFHPSPTCTCLCSLQEGQTPVLVAFSQGHSDLVDVLVGQYGCSMSEEEVSAVCWQVSRQSRYAEVTVGYSVVKTWARGRYDI